MAADEPLLHGSELRLVGLHVDVEQLLDGVSVLAGGDALVLGCVRLNMVARLPDASR